MFYISNSSEKDILSTINLINIYRAGENKIGLIYNRSIATDPRLYITFATKSERDAEFERFIKFLIKTGQAIEQDYVIDMKKK